MIIRRFVLSLSLIAIAACGGGSGSGDGSGGDAGSGSGDASGPGLCDHAADCGGDAVCDPSSRECTDGLPCDAEADCGAGGTCGESGTCEPNETGGPCVDSMACPVGQECLDGFCGCEGVLFTADRVPPNILISLDRSSSMVTNDVPGTSPTKNRWTVAKEAIGSLLAAHGDDIRFGLKLWPGSNLACSTGGSCSPGTVRVDPAEGTAAAINGDLAGAGTCNYGTPITGSLTSLLGDSRLLDSARPNYVILVTDGQQQSCTGDPVDAVADLRAQDPSVQVFVVGFSGDVDATQLTNMAIAAGTDRPGTPKYYQADNADQLNEAFDEIAGSVLSCTYVLDGAPPDDDLYVYFDGDPVDRDQTGTDGWNFDPGSNTITFYGAACESLQAGEVNDLQIVYGCPQSPVD